MERELELRRREPRTKKTVAQGAASASLATAVVSAWGLKDPTDL
jgi:hypothetical protein